MKVNFYYVVKVHQPGVDSIGRDADAEYVAGPFNTSTLGHSYIKANFDENIRAIYQVVHINTKVSV